MNYNQFYNAPRVDNPVYNQLVPQINCLYSHTLFSMRIQMFSKTVIITNNPSEFAESNNKYKQIMNWLPLLYCTVLQLLLFQFSKMMQLLKNEVLIVKHAFIHNVFMQCRNVYMSEELTPYDSEYESALMKGNISYTLYILFLNIYYLNFYEKKKLNTYHLICRPRSG